MFGTGCPKLGRAIELYRERFSTTGIYENKLYPGVPKALSSLRQLGATLFVATSKPTAFARRIVEHFGIAGDIREVVGSEFDGTRSDKAHLIAHILKAHSLSPTATFMVGDREHDVRGAKANAVAAIGALWGYGSRSEPLQAGATALREHPAEWVRVLS